MVFSFLSVIVGAAIGFVASLFKGPSRENETVSNIRYRLAYEESHREVERQESERRIRESEVQRAREKQEYERRVTALEEERKRLEVMEMDRKRREVELQRVQAATKVRREEESRQREEERRRRAEEERRKNEEGRQRREEERRSREAAEKAKEEEESRQRAEERKKREEERRRREEQERQRNEEERQRREEEGQERQKREEEERRKNEEGRQRREEERRSREAAKKAKKEEESRQRAEEREKREEERRRREEQERRRNEEERQRREEERQERQKREEEERRKNEEEKRELARRMQELARREKEQEEAIEKLRKEHAAQIEAERVFGGPLRWPTREEFHETLKRTQYDSNLFHFAIVGRAGSGKSSLINAFRNLRNRERGAAPTGTAETTLDIGRYPDPGREPPRQWMVWFDVPGAGTQRIPHQDYFVKQGLYVFDLIILAIGDRFEEIDARIIEDCKRFQVPTFIVRSKADMHILNSMKEYGDYARITDDPEMYSTCRESFITQSQKTVSDGLMRQKMPDQVVYIVSRDVLQRTYNSTLQNRGSAQLQQDQEVIHERHLVNALLEAAAERRCGTKERSNAQGAPGSARASHGGLFGETGWAPAPAPAAAPAPALVDPRRSARVELASAPGNQPQQDGIPAVVNPTLIEKIQKMIYPRKPTDADKLYTEMLSNSPELRNMLMEKPCMFTPTVALLTFYPLAPVPTEIKAFGSVLRVKEYEERERRGGGGRGARGGRGGRGRGATVQGRGGHVQTSAAESTGSEENNANTPFETTNRRGRRRQERGG